MTDSKQHSTPRADVLAEEYRGTYLWAELDKAQARIAELEEQLQTAERDAALAREARDHANECEAEWRQKNLGLLEQLEAAQAIVSAARELPEFFEAGGRTHSFVPLLDVLDAYPASAPGISGFPDKCGVASGPVIPEGSGAEESSPSSGEAEASTSSAAGPSAAATTPRVSSPVSNPASVQNPGHMFLGPPASNQESKP